MALDILTDPAEDDPALDAWGVIDHIGRSLHLKEPDLESTLEAVLRTATELIENACAAGLNLYERGRFTPRSVFGTEPPPLDALQKRTGTGPCIDASRDQEVVHVADMREEDRWPEFVAKAVDLGVLAMLCLPLRVDDLRLGSLSLYFRAPEHVGARDEQIARVLTAQAAVAIVDARRTENLRAALLNRDVIGQAKGVLMERHRLSADQAFAVLTRASQETNRKLSDIAAELALTGVLPGAKA